MSNNNTTSRRPAEITKCPFCDWKGSARGLHSHARLLHGKNIKNAREVSVNPYAINKAKKKEAISGISNTNKKVDYSSIAPLFTLDNILIAVGIGLIGKWLMNEIDKKTFQSECNKLKLDASKIRTATQNIKSPQRPTTTPPLK